MLNWIRNIAFSIIIFLVFLVINYVTNFSLTTMTILGGALLLFVGAGAHSTDKNPMNSGFNSKIAAFSISNQLSNGQNMVNNPTEAPDKANRKIGDTMMSIGACLLIIGFIVIMVG